MKYVVREDGTADYVRINVFANGKLFNAADNSCGFVIPFDVCNCAVFLNWKYSFNTQHRL
jgi:hypothetical protein